ncbi:MAG TPA: M20/M25/M40 family metallo-hydrolase, partial [Fimbriimonadaceae bacterium]|nr:M20/M25/M40 family metallo-hydrolase [Fimbriimonadaceae bacterium]
RGTGQPGYQKAADFMAARFKEFGLKPGGDSGSYFQQVPFQRTTVKAADSYVDFGGKVKVAVGDGAAFSSVARDLDLKGSLAIVEVPATQETLPADAQLEGKVVLLSGQPSQKFRLSVNQQRPQLVITVAKEVVQAQGVLRASGAGQMRGRPSLRISEAAFGRLVEGLRLPGELGKGDQYRIHAIDGETQVVAKVETEVVNVPNVVGVLEGSDPLLKEEYVGLGAHLDHLGTDGTTTYWGADDDGSGNTALLAVAKAFANNPIKPKRSVVFMAFCGEEMGLVGSRYYASNPTVPLEKMICELQMDMVGRNEETPAEKPEENVDTIHLVGSKRISTELHDLILDVNKHVGFKFEYDEEDVYTRSDHYSFAAKGVPIAFIFSGFHPDYHKPTDTVDKINFEKISNAARLFFLTAFEAANREKAFQKNVSGSGG